MGLTWNRLGYEQISENHQERCKNQININANDEAFYGAYALAA